MNLCLPGEWIIRELGMDMDTLLYLKWITNKDLLWGILLNVMYQPGWEQGLGENRYMYMYGWAPSIFTWNYHNIVNLLYPNTKLKLKEKISAALVCIITTDQAFIREPSERQYGSERGRPNQEEVTRILVKELCELWHFKSEAEKAIASNW